jgi:hypothetical protein
MTEKSAPLTFQPWLEEAIKHICVDYIVIFLAVMKNSGQKINIVRFLPSQEFEQLTIQSSKLGGRYRTGHRIATKF